jgi:hypothetical protein
MKEKWREKRIIVTRVEHPKQKPGRKKSFKFASFLRA